MTPQGGLSDTSKAAERVRIEVLRTLGPERRSLLAAELSELVLETAREGMRRRRPDCGEEELRLWMARRTLGDALFAKAFPNAPTDLQ